MFAADVSLDVLDNIIQNREYNKQIISYYKKLSTINSLYFSEKYCNKKVERIKFCNQIWIMNYYKDYKIKDFQKTSLCKDKFCANCKKVKQSARMAQYIPQLEPFKNKLFHLVLTVPNCSGVNLRLILKKMSNSFTRLIRFLEGRKKILGYDFNSYGYLGAIRSLEVTFKADSYHPHYHVALAFNNLDYNLSDSTIINKFSYSYNVLKRLFNPFEVLIQKVWYLLFNNITVNASNIANLELGYSCILDKFCENDYAELFKYMTKETDEKGNILTFNNFINLQYGLYRMKQIQGYGCFWNVLDEPDLEIFDKVYDNFIESLNKKENPSRTYDTPQQLLRDFNNVKIISRKSYFKYLRETLD